MTAKIADRDLESRIIARLEETAARGDNRDDDSRYHKYEYQSLGMRAPDFYAVMKEFRPEIKALPPAIAKRVAENMMKRHVEEITQAGISVLATSRAIGPGDIAYLDKLGEHLSSWSTVDSFAPSILHKLLEEHPAKVLPLIRKWNKSKNMWKQRASVVAFTRKASASGKYTGELLKLCENLINTKEDLVQKGIGWAEYVLR